MPYDLLINFHYYSTLQPDNKLNVLQSLMLHDILVKRKSILDQFRKGLSTLGFLAEMEHNPSLFEECFVHQGVLSNDFVISCLHFEESRDLETSGDRVYQMLQTFLRNLCLDALKNFLKFVTGTYMKFPCLTCHIVFQYLAILVTAFLHQHVYLN